MTSFKIIYGMMFRKKKKEKKAQPCSIYSSSSAMDIQIQQAKEENSVCCLSIGNAILYTWYIEKKEDGIAYCKKVEREVFAASECQL